jgi:hypothetical protein
MVIFFATLRLGAGREHEPATEREIEHQFKDAGSRWWSR